VLLPPECFGPRRLFLRSAFVYGLKVVRWQRGSLDALPGSAGRGFSMEIVAGGIRCARWAAELVINVRIGGAAYCGWSSASQACVMDSTNYRLSSGQGTSVITTERSFAECASLRLVPLPGRRLTGAKCMVRRPVTSLVYCW
jgi:hypothetical protein